MGKWFRRVRPKKAKAKAESPGRTELKAALDELTKTGNGVTDLATQFKNVQSEVHAIQCEMSDSDEPAEEEDVPEEALGAGAG